MAIAKDFYCDIEKYGEKIAVISENGEKHTYDQLIAAADSFSEGISERSLVFLMCLNQYEAIAAYLGCLRKKAAVMLINPKTEDQALKYLFESYKPCFVFAPNNMKISGRIVRQQGNYDLIKTENSEPPKMVPELAVLITTSGSTGSPKFVMQSYKNINANAASIVEYLGITSDDRAITTMPMNYTFGLSIIQSHLLAGAAIIATEKTLIDKAFWTLLKEQEATTFSGVPYIYQMLRQLRFERVELPSVRYVTQSGSKLPKEFCVEFTKICKSKGIEFIAMYGQTEATARMSYLPGEYALSKAGSIGIAIPGGRLTLIDVDGSEITTPDVAGELVYYGDNVTLGYARSASDLNNGDTFGGRLSTGDIAKFDSDGFYYIVGRKKRFLKIFGNRVNLDEAENLLNKEGFTCVCGGRDDKLVIYLENGTDEQCVRAVEFLSSVTNLNRSAFKTVIIDEIPRSDSGKILYSKLEEIYDKL